MPVIAARKRAGEAGGLVKQGITLSRWVKAATLYRPHLYGVYYTAARDLICRLATTA